MSTRLGIAVLLYMMVQGVVFGIGTVLVLATPVRDLAMQLMPIVIALSLIIAAPIAWWLAPRLRARYWREHPEGEDAGDRILSSMS